jgi:hypothetical protein
MTPADRDRLLDIASDRPLAPLPTPEDIRLLLAEIAHLDLCFSFALHVAMECATEAAMERVCRLWEIRDQGETRTVQ